MFPSFSRASSWFILILCVLCAQSVAGFADTSATAATGPSAEALLQLQEKNGQALQTMETEMDSTMETNGKTVTSRTKMWIDKSKGDSRIQQLDDQGKAHVEIMAQGTDAYYHTAAGTWIKLPMNSHTQATLETLGVNFGKTNKASRRTGDAATEIAASIAQMKENFSFERRPEKDDASRHLRCVCKKPLSTSEGLPWDEEFDMYDERDGTCMEKSQWVRADRWPGGKEKIPRDAVHRSARDGSDMVELSEQHINQAMTVNGVDTPRDMDDTHYTVAGKVARHTVWKNYRINEDIDPSVWERK